MIRRKRGRLWSPHGVAVGAILGVALFTTACTTNAYLKRYKLQTIEEERELLAKVSPSAADEVLAAKEALREDPRRPESMVQLARAYATIAEQIGDSKNPMYEYSVEAAGYELKLYKARGGPFPPVIIAETGRNLYLRDRDCQARRWLDKAVQMDAALSAEYADVLKRSRAGCEGTEK